MLLNNPKLPPRFWSKVRVDQGCWLWQGYCTRLGYGRFALAGKPRAAHRVAYSTLIGEIGVGLEIDHLCRRRNCVNPAHLEPVSPAVNKLRGSGVGVVNANKTQCPKGHDLSGENLLLSIAGRRCATCRRYQERERMRARRAAL